MDLDPCRHNGQVTLVHAHAKAPRAGLVIATNAVLAGLGLFTWWMMRISPLSTAGCHPHCDDELLAAVVSAYLFAVPIIVVASIGLTAVLWRRGWWALLPGALGIVVMTAAFWIGSALASKAMLLS